MNDYDFIVDMEFESFYEEIDRLRLLINDLKTDLIVMEQVKDKIISDKDASIKALKEEIKNKESYIRVADDTIETQVNQIDELHALVTLLELDIADLEEENEQLEEENKRLKKELRFIKSINQD